MEKNTISIIQGFIQDLTTFLKTYGYISKITKQDFHDFIVKTDQINMSALSVIHDVIDFIQKIITQSEEFESWIKVTKKAYTRNINGYVTLLSIHNAYSMKFSSQFDIHQTFDDFLVDLLYLKFELQYRIKIDVPEITIQTLADYIYFEKVFAEPKLHSKWVFRGQANEKWPLEASILRNINRSDTSIMNKQSIEKLYQEYELIDKYHNIFASSDLDYTFLSYMQHATSFSPFIDFTMNFIIATSFAMNNRSTVNDFFNNNSAIYCMPIIENQNIEQKIEEYRVGLLAANRNWSIEDLTILYQGMGTVYKPFADVTYSDDQTNDRMKYQKGIFILYDNFISYTSSSVPYYFVNNMIKLVIHHSAKKEIYDYIYHHYQQYHQYFLMNPYQYFSE